jgi:1,4-dihydroxy-2-naphthoate octaprenyltransferase
VNTYAVDVGWTRKVAAYAQLGKIRVYHHLYEWLLVVLLLRMDPSHPHGWLTASILLLVLIVGAQAAACAADDLTGFRDGSDVENYRKGSLDPDAPKMLPKPLVVGLLTEREVIVFAVGATLVAAAALLGAFASLDWDVSVGAPIASLLVLAVTIQYSSGIKFSYWPGGAEFHIFVVNTALLVLPYWAIAGDLPTVVYLLGALAGAWFVLVVGWGNVRDRAGDEAVDRRTLAVVAPKAYPVFLVTLYLISVVLAVLPFALDYLEPVGLLCVVPLLALATAQMYFGAIRKNAAMAMWLGFRCIDAGGLGFAAAILLST